jgi:hypothetical protein
MVLEPQRVGDQPISVIPPTYVSGDVAVEIVVIDRRADAGVVNLVKEKKKRAITTANLARQDVHEKGNGENQ